MEINRSRDYRKEGKDGSKFIGSQKLMGRGHSLLPSLPQAYKTYFGWGSEETSASEHIFLGCVYMFVGGGEGLMKSVLFLLL